MMSMRLSLYFPQQQNITSAHSVHSSGKGAGIAVTHQPQIHCCHWPEPPTPPLLPVDWAMPLPHHEPRQRAPLQTSCADPRGCFSLPTVSLCVWSEAETAPISDSAPIPAQNRALSAQHLPLPSTQSLPPFPSQARSLHIPGKLLHGCFC